MKVLLVGNYGPDHWWSMSLYSEFLRRNLGSADFQLEIVRPPTFFARLAFGLPVLCKWFGYVDKYLLFPPLLKLRAPAYDLIHICDQSNAVYRPCVAPTPCLVTCHDMLAIRGALGDSSVFCTPSLFGHFLQRWILGAMASSPYVAFVSAYTLRDFLRLTRRSMSDGEFRVIHNTLYRPLSPTLNPERLQCTHPELLKTPYLLTLGDSHPRKNRESAIRTIHLLGNTWKGLLVIAGRPLSPDHCALVAELGINHRIREIVDPDHSLLNILYLYAHALLFPSYSEGFGLPVIEAQQCCCPVICSTATVLPEVAGDGAILCEPDDLSAMARAVIRLEDPSARSELIAAGLANLSRFDVAFIRDQYSDFYRAIVEPSPS